MRGLESQETSNVTETYKRLSPLSNINDISGSLLREKQLVAIAVSICPAALDQRYYPSEAINSSIVYFFPIFSSDLFYSEYHADPIFPAIYPGHAPPESDGVIRYFFSNTTQLNYQACVDRTQICEGDTTTCRDLPDWGSFLCVSDPQKVTEADMALDIVAVALSASSSGEAIRLSSLAIRSHCQGFRSNPLPRE